MTRDVPRRRAPLVAVLLLLPACGHASDRGDLPDRGLPPPVPTVASAAPTLRPDGAAIPPGTGAPDDPAGYAGAPTASNPVPIRLVRLRIPAIGVDAPVEDVGVRPHGQLQIPDDPRALGRWAGGAAPGEPYGSAVVVGHVDSAVRGAGAFFRLREVGPGELVVAVGVDGRTITYRIVARRTVDKNDLVAATDPFRQDLDHRLVLITCGGPFDSARRHYRDNVVVFGTVLARH